LKNKGISKRPQPLPANKITFQENTGLVSYWEQERTRLVSSVAELLYDPLALYIAATVNSYLTPLPHPAHGQLYEQKVECLVQAQSDPRIHNGLPSEFRELPWQEA
jgi:hypothetical protein